MSGTVDRARDVESPRTVIRQLFKQIILRPWNWDDLPEIETAGVGVGDRLFLIPVLREGVAEWSSLPPKINRVPRSSLDRWPQDATQPSVMAGCAQAGAVAIGLRSTWRGGGVEEHLGDVVDHLAQPLVDLIGELLDVALLQSVG